MARPETIDDLTGDRTTGFGSIDVDVFADNADLLVAFAAFQKAVVKAGGKTKKGPYNRSQVEFVWPKDESELEVQLSSEQRTWDEMRELYHLCSETGSAPESWRKNSLAEWAKNEGLPAWEDAFAAIMDDELAGSSVLEDTQL